MIQRGDQSVNKPSPVACAVRPDSMARMVASLGDVSVANVSVGVSLEAVTA